MKIGIALFICALASGRALAADDISPLLDKMAKAYGGRERLEKIVAIRETGQVTSAMGPGDPGPILRVLARPAKLKVVVGEPSNPKEVRIVNGANGWRNGRASTGASYEAMVLQAVRLDLPFQLLSHKAKLVEKAPIQQDGKQLRAIELLLEGGLTVTAGIDAETGRILVSTGMTAGGPNGRMTFSTAYDDFRIVDGVLFAFKEANSANETKTADTTLTSVEFLKHVPEEEFKPSPPPAQAPQGH